MKLPITIFAVATLCASPAFAMHDGTDHPRPEQNKADMIEAKTRYFFDKADADGDGRISKYEHDAVANDMFRNADKNRDNMVTYREMKAAKVEEMNEMKKDLRARSAIKDAHERMDDHDHDDYNNRNDRY